VKVQTMLTRQAVFLLFVIVVFCTMTRALDCQRSEPRTAEGLKAVEQTWLSILDHKDQAGLRCLLDPNFADTTWKGETHDLDQAVASMMARPDFMQTVDVRKTALYGNTGVAWGITTVSNASGQVLMRIAFTDVFRYNGKKWMAVMAQETPITTEKAR
jgi:hypothetical protein